MKLTITEAAASYKVPRSRIVRAIKAGYLPTEKAPGKAGKHLIDADLFAAHMRETKEIKTSGRTVIVRVRTSLLLTAQEQHHFATTAAMKQCEEMVRRLNR